MVCPPFGAEVGALSSFSRLGQVGAGGRRRLRVAAAAVRRLPAIMSGWAGGLAAVEGEEPRPPPLPALP